MTIKLFMILAFSSLVVMATLSSVNATMTIQKNNFCTTTTEKEQGIFKQTIFCDYWRNSSNITPISGGGLGFGGWVGRGIDWKLPEQPTLSPDIKKPDNNIVVVFIFSALFALLILSITILLTGKRKTKGGN